MARNSEVHIVLGRGITEISFKWLVSLALERRKHRAGGTGKSREGIRDILLGGTLQAAKKTGRTPHVSIEQISAIEV